MEERNINHSFGELLLLSMSSIALGVFFVYLKFADADNEESLYIKIGVWLCILFCILAGSCFLYILIREHFMHKPYLTIGEDCLIIRSPNTKIINYTDIESIQMEERGDGKTIDIYYWKNTEHFAYSDQTRTKYVIDFKFTLEIDPGDLLDLLNERLEHKK